MKIAIWTDNDLDGAGSAIAIKHMFKNKASEIFIKDVSDPEFIGLFKGWQAQHFDEYDKIFILDLFVPDELIPFVDDKKVIIIDHHQTHVEKLDRYKTAKIIVEYYTSCVGLILEKFKPAFANITPELKTLFALIDDYDCYELKYTDTLKLNAVYHAYNKPKIDHFLKRFENGMQEFNITEQNAIRLYFKKYKETIDTTTFFTGYMSGFKIISCMASNSINEVAHYCIKKLGADIAIVVIPFSMSVSFRKNKETCSIKLNKLAEALCDGGGHEYASGGKITDKFLAFTKSLTHYEDSL